MTIAERLVQIREQHGYSRKRLADELGKPYPTITKYENGTREPGHEYLMLIAEKFGVTVDYILGLEKEKAPSEDGASDDVVFKFFRSLPLEQQRGILLALGAPAEVLAALGQQDTQE